MRKSLTHTDSLKELENLCPLPFILENKNHSNWEKRTQHRPEIPAVTKIFHQENYYWEELANINPENVFYKKKCSKANTIFNLCLSTDLTSESAGSFIKYEIQIYAPEWFISNVIRFQRMDQKICGEQFRLLNNT